jgi:hypothetical protein
MVGEHPTVPLDDVAAEPEPRHGRPREHGKLQVLAAGTAESVRELDERRRRAGRARAAGEHVGQHDGRLERSRDVPEAQDPRAASLQRPARRLPQAERRHRTLRSGWLPRRSPTSASISCGVCALRAKLAFIEPKVDPEREADRSAFRSWFGSVPNYAWEKKGVSSTARRRQPGGARRLLEGRRLLSMGDIQFDSVNDFMFALETVQAGRRRAREVPARRHRIRRRA